MTTVIAVVATLVVTALVTWFLATTHFKNVSEAKLGSADERARKIIDNALKEAEDTKREKLLEAKEEALKTRNDLEKEVKDRRNEMQRSERRIQQKEENVEKRTEAIERREQSLSAREENLNKKTEEVAKLNEQRLQELEKISGLTSDQAKEYLLKIVEDDVKHESAIMIKNMEAEAKEEADKRAKEIVVGAIQRCAADHVSETTISVVSLVEKDVTLGPSRL